MIINLADFYLGVLTGVVGAMVFAGFAAALVTFAGADADKRGLSGRHRREAPGVAELPATHFAALPVVAPQKDPNGLGSSTVAGRLPSSRPPRLKRRTHVVPKN